MRFCINTIYVIISIEIGRKQESHCESFPNLTQTNLCGLKYVDGDLEKTIRFSEVKSGFKTFRRERFATDCFCTKVHKI